MGIFIVLIFCIFFYFVNLAIRKNLSTTLPPPAPQRSPRQVTIAVAVAVP